MSQYVKDILDDLARFSPNARVEEPIDIQSHAPSVLCRITASKPGEVQELEEKIDELEKELEDAPDELDREKLISTMDATLSLTSEQGEVSVLFSADEKELTIDYSDKRGEAISATIQGHFNPCEFKVNARNFVTCLKHIGGDTVRIELGDDNLTMRNGNDVVFNALMKVK